MEQEAVRRSTQFQVGGKWCSFVAVSDDGKETVEQEWYENLSTPSSNFADSNRPRRHGGKPAGQAHAFKYKDSSISCNPNMPSENLFQQPSLQQERKVDNSINVPLSHPDVW